MEKLEGLNIENIIELIQNPFSKNSPFKLRANGNEVYQEVPIVNQVKLFASIIQSQKEISLTKKGFLSTKTVKDLYQNGFLKDALFEEGLFKVYKEMDCEPVHFTRLICEIGGIIKKRNNKVTLTKKGQELIKSESDLFNELFRIVTQIFNIGYFDGYDCETTGQYGIMVTLFLLNKYGKQYQSPGFYAKKYMKIIPGIFDNFPEPNYSNKISVFNNCFTSRTFTRSLNYFGLLEIERKNLIDISRVKKSEIFDKLLYFEYKLPNNKMN